MRPGRRVKLGLVSRAAVALLVAAGPGAMVAARAQTPDARHAGPDGDSQDSANGNPAAQKAVHDAIPLTEDMIRDLARRYNANKRAVEESVAETAVPINRQINLSFAPGGAPASSTQ